MFYNLIDFQREPAVLQLLSQVDQHMQELI